MPILNVKISAAKSPHMTAAISSILLDLTTRILRKDPKVTAIAIDYVDPADWIVGGASLAEQGKAASISTSRSPTRPIPRRKRRSTSPKRLPPSPGCSATCTRRVISTYRMSGRPPTAMGG